MKIKSELDLINILRDLANTYGIVGGLYMHNNLYIINYLESMGLAETIKDKKGKQRKVVLIDELNEYLKPYGLYADIQGENTERTMLEYLTRFGAVENGVFKYTMVYAPNEKARIESGDPYALEQKSMRKRLTRYASLAGKTPTEYVKENLGLEIDMSNKQTYRNMPIDEIKTSIVKEIREKQQNGEEITELDKKLWAQKLKYAGAETKDVSPIVEILLKENAFPNKQYIKRTDDVYDRIVEDILKTWPDGVLCGYSYTPERSNVYARMKNYFYNIPHKPNETFTDYWQKMFLLDSRLNGFRFKTIKTRSEKVEARHEELFKRALSSPTIYVAPDGSKHAYRLFEDDRSAYNLFRKEALLRKMSIDEYLLNEHGIVLDHAKAKFIGLNSSVHVDAPKPTKKSDGKDEM